MISEMDGLQGLVESERIQKKKTTSIIDGSFVERKINLFQRIVDFKGFSEIFHPIFTKAIMGEIQLFD